MASSSNRSYSSVSGASTKSKEVNRKLVVLDLDNTLCDFTYLEKCPTVDFQKAEHSGRPFLNYFLTMIYEYYDIIIWSATDSDSIRGKLLNLGISSGKEYTIMKCMDNSEMEVIQSGFGEVRVKSLAVIWKNYPLYDQTNTIIIDDQYINFFQTPNNGLQIKPYFRSMHKTDDELVFLAEYLNKLANYCPDFSQEDHKNWKRYKPSINF